MEPKEKIVSQDGGGTRTVTVRGFDADGNPVTEVVTLNGTTPVVTDIFITPPQKP